MEIQLINNFRTFFQLSAIFSFSISFWRDSPIGGPKFINSSLDLIFKFGHNFEIDHYLYCNAYLWSVLGSETHFFHCF